MSEDATRLDTLERSFNGAKSEVRIERATFNGSRPFTSLRLWELGADGEMHPTKKGLTVRDGELPRAIAALERSLEIARASESKPAEPSTNAAPEWLARFHEKQDRTREPQR